ncbi:MAG TPA: metal ABC transporter substrate-binding protein [Burkholderiales bacterium]|nr:metal ABC transporter substrate-binding protein [Burkholderiales bacterium]
MRGVVLALALAAAPGPGHAQLRVVTTSADLKSIAEAVGGARIAAESLAAPEHDPHTLELTPAQLARARSADLVIRVGLDHEPWFAKLGVPSRVAVLDASRNVRLLQTRTPRLRAERASHVHAFGNTHYWLDPENAVAIAAAIREALAKLRPNDAAVFETGARAFSETVGKKTAEWRRTLAPHRGAKLVVMHDSWSYLAEAFGLQIVAAAEPHPGVPPAPGELAELVRRMREARVPVLIAEPHSNAALARLIASETGARVAQLHASGYDYVRSMDANVSALAAALASAR